jgi:hypothetical protein
MPPIVKLSFRNRLSGVPQVANRRLLSQFDEPFVKSVSDDVVVMVTGVDEAVEDGFDNQWHTRTAQLEVAQPQLSVGEFGLASVLVEQVSGGTSHGIHTEIHCSRLCPCGRKRLGLLTKDSTQDRAFWVVTGPALRVLET